MMLDRFCADGNVYLLFQHAEETGQGAKECLGFPDEILEVIAMMYRSITELQSE